MKFRRNTHDRNGTYRGEAFFDSFLQKGISKTHGHIIHYLSSKEAMTLDDLFDEIRKDVTNFRYGPADIDGVWYEGSPLPTVGEVTLSLVRLIEAGYVEVVEDDFVITQPKKVVTYNYAIYLPDNPGGKPYYMNNADREDVKNFVSGYRETSHYMDTIKVDEISSDGKKVTYSETCFYHKVYDSEGNLLATTGDMADTESYMKSLGSNKCIYWERYKAGDDKELYDTGYF